MPAGPCTGAPRRKLPTGHPSVARPPGHKSLSGALSTGLSLVLPAACPTPRDYPVKSFGKVQGYHSNDTLVALAELGIRSYVSEPDRGRRNWRDKPDARAAVYANRRRIRGARGKRLLRQRGERLERPHAHLYETGRLRRVHLRGHANVLKRLLVHVCGSNLGLLMRELTGVGTPRSLQGRARALLDALIRALSRRWRPVAPSGAACPFDPGVSSWIAHATHRQQLVPLTLQRSRSATGC